MHHNETARPRQQRRQKHRQAAAVVAVVVIATEGHMKIMMRYTSRFEAVLSVVVYGGVEERSDVLREARVSESQRYSLSREKIGVFSSGSLASQTRPLVQAGSISRR